MRIAIFGKTITNGQVPFIARLLHCMDTSGIRYTVYKPFYDQYPDEFGNTGVKDTFCSAGELSHDIDFLFSIGGDGTLLHTLSLVRDSGIPVLGFNTGRLGFLSSIGLDETERAIGSLISGDYTLESRSLLKLVSDKPLFEDVDFALNEITVSKVHPDSMISIRVTANGDFLNNYWADGLIVATPTGSTAYSLSCGGPIITPDSRNIIITPISIHNLTVRPLVLPDDAEIGIRVDARNQQYSVSLDSRTATTSSDTELIIRKEAFNINLVQIRGKHFFSTLRDKLMWGQDKRN